VRKNIEENCQRRGYTYLFDALTRNRAFGHYARILVDIDLSNRVSDEILVEREGFAFKLEVQYECRPFFCRHCFVIGHNITTCKWLHPKADNEKSKVDDISKKVTHHSRSDKGASSSGTLQYVPVVPQASASNVLIKDSERVVPKDLSSSTFSYALNNVTDSVPQGALPIPTIHVLDLVTVDEHDDENISEDEGMENTVSKEPVISSSSVLNVEHATIHDDNVSPAQVTPLNIPSMEAPAAAALADTDTELAAAQTSAQQFMMSPTATAACVAIPSKLSVCI